MKTKKIGVAAALKKYLQQRRLVFNKGTSVNVRNQNKHLIQLF
jgi:hypothetical protein